MNTTLHPQSDSLLQVLNAPLGQRALGDGQVFLNYGELQQRGMQLAAILSRYTAPSTVVAISLDNGIDWILADLASQLANVCSLPLPGFFTPAQCTHALRQTGASLWVLAADKAPPEGDWQSVTTAVPGIVLYHNPAVAHGEALPAQTGKITYTSGSTGTPKGVCLSNRQLIRQAQALADVTGFSMSDAAPRHLCLLPLSVLLENVAGVYTCLLSGGTVIAPPLEEVGLSGSSRLSVPTLIQAISNYQPNTLILIPQMLTALVAACESGWQAPGSLRFIAVGGSKVSPHLLRRARHLGLPVYEGYGLSECASVVSLNTPEYDLPGSAGQPLPHLQVAIKNNEICISGNPFLGYVGDPQSWGQQTIASGDRGALDERGFLHLQGRHKNLLINSFGRNISPEWVEAELLASGQLQDAMVFGDGKPFLCALLYCRNPDMDSAAVQALIDQCNSRLPDYAHIGAWLTLPQPLASFPGLVTATGKPRREEIRQHFAQQLEQLYSIPRSSLQDQDMHYHEVIQP